MIGAAKLYIYEINPFQELSIQVNHTNKKRAFIAVDVTL